MNKRYYFFVGTTAELIKLAPVIHELKKRKQYYKIIASNQNVLHFDELSPLFGKLSPDYTFKMKPIKWPKDIYLRFIIWLIKSLGNYILYFKNEFKKGDKKSSILIVHGDTISALIGAIVAKICGVKLIHIESGLRSFNFLEPFPEEINRFIVSHIADVHFCPNAWAVSNLKGSKGIKVNTYNNTIGENIKIAVSKIGSKKPDLVSKSRYFVLVIHRQEHTLFNKSNTKKLVEKIIKETNSSLKCVFIMHKLTSDYLKKQKLFSKIKSNPNIMLPSRLPYLKFISLLKNSEYLISDGGSNQEEAYFLGLPCLVLRSQTERIEGLGKNAVMYKNNDAVITNFMKNYKEYKRTPIAIKVPPSKIIVDYLNNIINDKN